MKRHSLALSRTPICTFIFILFLGGTALAQYPPPTPEPTPVDYRTTAHYQDALAAWKKNPFRRGTEVDFEKKYERFYDVKQRYPNTVGEDVSDFFEAMNRAFKEGMGMDPDKPFSEQFAFEKTVVYVPVEGYAQLHGNQAKVDRWHRFLFTARLENALENIAPAHERAQVAIRQCDESLLAQSLRELDFVISEFEAVGRRAQEQIDQNEHQNSYYNQRSGWLSSPEDAPLLVGSNAKDISEYLKLDISMFMLNRSDPYKRNDVVKNIIERMHFIDAWTRRIEKVLTYVNANLPKLRENKTRIRAAFEAKKCGCNKPANKPR